jgi:hypothetical protein
MPRSLLISSLLLVIVGIAGLLSTAIFSTSTTAFGYFGTACVISGLGLLLRYSWGRSLASILIFFGYLAAAIFLISGLIPPGKGGIEVWQRFGIVFLGVAILTSIYGLLWSRPVTRYLNRGNDVEIPK